MFLFQEPTDNNNLQHVSVLEANFLPWSDSTSSFPMWHRIPLTRVKHEWMDWKVASVWSPFPFPHGKASPVSMAFLPHMKLDKCHHCLAPLFRSTGAQGPQGTKPCCAKDCLKGSSNSYPDKRYGGLNGYKDLLVSLVALSRLLTRNKPPGESSQALLLPFFWKHSWVLYLVPSLSRLGAWRKSIDF